jgi:hypothetical protein
VTQPGDPHVPPTTVVMDAMQNARDGMRAFLKQVDDESQPVIAIMAEQQKSLTSLASWALVLSISVAQLIPGHARWPVLLAIAWVLLAGVVAVGGAWYYYHRVYRHFHLAVWNDLSALEEVLLRTPVPRSVDQYQQAVAAKRRPSASAAVDVGSAMMRMSQCNDVMYVFFAAGLGLLVVFAVANTPGLLEISGS